jgi:hypothetical protein
VIFGDSVVVVGDDVIVCVVRPGTREESVLLAYAGLFPVELASAEVLPDGRDLLVFQWVDTLNTNATRHSEVAEMITELLLGS